MKILRGGSEKIVALGGGAPKICILQNQHMTSSYRSRSLTDRMVFNSTI